MGNSMSGGFPTGNPYSFGGSISSFQQNGFSSWGTANQWTLPLFRSGGGTRPTGSYGFPWGNINTNSYNPYTSAPNTGVTRSYAFTVAPCNIAPDGVTTNGAVCVNGQFPGPMIEANYGDTIQVTVTNGMIGEGTSMHWHGMLQTNTNWEDGVPGVQQCPIAPGQSYTYSFQATLYGSSWYHTHYSAQYAGGAVGPMVIHGPSQVSYDVDIGPVMLQELYRNNYMSYVTGLLNPLAKGGPAMPLANDNLINGKMRFDCTKTQLPCSQADYSKFNFTTGKTHRLRLMNTGASAIQKFSIDGHVMQVIANDYMPVQPYNTSMVTLGVGQRTDVLVYANGSKTGTYWMRSNIVGCSLNDGVQTEALAAIYYPSSNYNSWPTAPANHGPAANPSPMSCGNAPLSVTTPMYSIAAATPGTTQELDINVKSNGTHLLYYFNNNSFRANFNSPILGSVAAGNLNSFAANENVYNSGTNSSVRVVIYNYNDAPHPIHLHGHNMQVLQLGMGKWDGSITRSSNPQRRDVQVMPPGSTSQPSYLVIQWTQDNPGVWPLHCHFAWHSGMGLLINLLERPQDILRFRSIPSAISQTCMAWNAFSKLIGSLVTDIDSGV